MSALSKRANLTSWFRFLFGFCVFPLFSFFGRRHRGKFLTEPDKQRTVVGGGGVREIGGKYRVEVASNAFPPSQLCVARCLALKLLRKVRNSRELNWRWHGQTRKKSDFSSFSIIFRLGCV